MFVTLKFYWASYELTLFFLFNKNIFYKNIEAEICEILEYFKNKPEAERFWKAYNFVCWKFVNTMQSLAMYMVLT